MQQTSFSVPDYCVFFAMLAISALIGFYYAYKSKSMKNTDDFLLGGRKLQIFPVAMSIMASFTSAVSVLGFPQEMYKFGSMYWMISFSYFICQPLAAHVFVPFFHNLRITSAYEYLQMRFDHKVRVVASLIFCAQMLLYMSVALYTPSVAIRQVTGLSLWISILLTGVVCTLYTTMGGMKAVIWTDTFQVFVIFAGVFAIIVKGLIKIGGLSEMWDIADKGGRIEFFEFDPNPTIRHSIWSLVIGGCFTSLTVYASNQATIQRYLTLRTARDAQKAMYINLFGTWLVLTILCLAGLIAYGVYHECDLISSKLVIKGEEILPRMVMDLLADMPGLPGLFVAAVYSAALSTISSGLNSLATVCLKDFIQPFYVNYPMTETRATNISKIIAFVFGIATVAIAFACQYLGSSMLQISLSLFGLLGGPLFGVISLGMFVPFANAKGALAGLLCSTAINLWIGIGSVVYPTPPQLKPMRTDGCNVTSNLSSTTILSYFSGFTTDDFSTESNFSSYQTSSSTTAPSLPSNAFVLYRISYLWFALISLIITHLVGISVSLATGRTDPNSLDKKLLYDRNYDYHNTKPDQTENGFNNDGIELEDDESLSRKIGRSGLILKKSEHYF